MLNRISILYLLMIIKCTGSTLAAAEDPRFPHLSRLPEKSLVRQKCLAYPNAAGLFKDDTEHACEELESRLRYVTDVNSDKSKISSNKSVKTEEYIRTILFNKPGFISSSFEFLKPTDHKLKDHYQKEMEVASEFVFYVELIPLLQEGMPSEH